jgi:hypothetical protein
LQDPFVQEVARLLGAAGVCHITDGFAQFREMLQGLARQPVLRPVTLNQCERLQGLSARHLGN